MKVFSIDYENNLVTGRSLSGERIVRRVKSEVLKGLVPGNIISVSSNSPVED